MQYEIVELPARTIVGPAIRTSNNTPEEGAAIGALWQRFMENGMHEAIADAQLEPYTCYGAYFNYDMQTMSYDMMVACETVSDIVPEGMQRYDIPAGRYAKFALHGDCVNTVQEAWLAIWNDADLVAKRSFTVDFEAYPPAEDMNDTDIDIYIALK